jgi:hypothetical protein
MYGSVGAITDNRVPAKAKVVGDWMKSTFTKPDGSTVDVRLDASFGVVVIEGDSETGDGADDD